MCTELSDNGPTGAGLWQALARGESGAATITGLVWVALLLILGGLAVDGANAWRVQNQLQVASDASALGAASNLPDEAKAREVALALADRNVGPGVIRAEDIVFGRWDDATGTFAVRASPPDAAWVSAARTVVRQNPVPTFLMQLAGVHSWDVPAMSIARANASPGGGSVAGCENATFLSEESITVGGGNDFFGPVCLHGEGGLSTGGNEHFDPEVRLSAPRADMMRINSTRPGSARPEDLTVERSMEPRLLPILDDLFASLWEALYLSGISEYGGDLVPDFVKNAEGVAKVVRKKGAWSIQPGEIEPYTIYVVDGRAQFAGDIDAQNVAFVVRNQLGAGGGIELNFRDFFAIGNQLNVAGNIDWGDRDAVCQEKRCSVYLFGLDSLSMGGFGNVAEMNGVVGVAPRLYPGGGLRGKGVYFEGEKGYILGGDMQVTGCDAMLGVGVRARCSVGANADVRAGSYLVR